MKRLHTAARVLLAVNGAVLGIIGVLFLLRADVSGGSILDVPGVVLGYYALFVLPITTVVAVAILLRRSRVRIAGGTFLVVGALLFLANYSVLVEGHTVAVRVYDAEGRMKVDESGNAVVEVNPAYVDFKRRQFRRTILALGMVSIGAVVLLVDTRLSRARERKDAQPAR